MRIPFLLLPLLAAPALPQITIKTSQAEFEVSAGGYLRAHLLKGGQRLTLDEPAATDTSDSVRANGSPLGPFVVDPSRVRRSARRVEIPACVCQLDLAPFDTLIWPHLAFVPPVLAGAFS